MKACYTLAAKNAVGVALLTLEMCLQSREKVLKGLLVTWLPANVA